MTKNNFILHHDTLSVIKELTDEQAGKLIKEIYEYSLYLNNPKKAKKPSGLSGLLNSVCHPFKMQLERDFQAYTKKVDANRENGKKGGRPKINKNPKKAKKADSDNDNDNDSDNKNIKEKYKKEIFEIPSWIDSDSWNEFMEVRKKLKAVQSDGALKELISKLEKFKEDGHDPNEVIRNSIVNSWKGVFAPKTNLQPWNNRNDTGRKPGEWTDEMLETEL